jgi:hypothetical protein
MHVSELGFSPAALACLEAAGLTDIQHLATHTATDLIDSGHFVNDHQDSPVRSWFFRRLIESGAELLDAGAVAAHAVALAVDL